MGSFCILCALLAVALPRLEGHPCGAGEQCRAQALDGSELALMFRGFMKTYNKTYKDGEDEMRHFKIFAENMEKARKLQAEERGSAEYGVTKFSDLSADEIEGRILKPDLGGSLCKDVTFDNPSRNIPDSMDWRKHGAVTPVKDQRIPHVCKSCWAFAVVGNIESQWSIQTKTDAVELSEQELIDCGAERNNCNSGFIDEAFHDVVQLRGLVREGNYTYTGRKGACHFNRAEIVAKIKDCNWIDGNESVLQHYVANGTVAAIFNRGGLKFYTTGVVRSNCPDNGQDHSMLIVGYGTDTSTNPNTPYWIVKNSWGSDWGEEGYVRIYRGENTCGITDFPMFAVI